MKITEDLNYQIAISLTSEKEVASLNEKYKNKSGSTDVLSFEINQDLGDGEYYLGDVVINKQAAQSQAIERGVSVEEEISELVKHGILHLLGVHHEGDE